LNALNCPAQPVTMPLVLQEVGTVDRHPSSDREKAGRKVIIYLVFSHITAEQAAQTVEQLYPQNPQNRKGKYHTTN
jgi:hypothetical protein